MKGNKLVISGLLLAVFNTAAYTAQFELKTDAKTIQLKQAPKNIAVYDLSVLDTLNALNIQAQIVPETTYQGHLAKYKNEKFIKAGTLFEPNLEKLKQAQPDLIFIGGRSAKNLDTLSQIAPTLNLSPDTTQYIPDLKQRTELLAQAFKREKIAKQKLNEVEKLQKSLKAKTQGKSAIMLFAVGDNFMPHAENDRFGFVYDLAGFKSVLPLTEKTTSTTRPEAGSPEALAQAKKNIDTLQKAIDQHPDYIIVLDRGAVNTQKYAAKDNILKHHVLSNAQAVKNKKVIFVNADAWYLTGAGLDNTIFMLNELSQAVQP
ncbi:siderophore ABC transporter substrate-binding protein [Acinetobacter shaoyimingii]|uniref:ABC transporter substrate-binding protein n=1 Tax=Acinetobacter shaoyimingii TaxID=2715164 RepID=A0A6G8RTL1_9GAMM|nr:ABC transporter substrate-binding protein [Acinetobacter shaoyimingii]QIO05266.1 ABC transporter substrate-binding protein [Acinetobacter shaoyimingii]